MSKKKLMLKADVEVSEWLLLSAHAAGRLNSRGGARGGGASCVLMLNSFYRTKKIREQLAEIGSESVI